MRIAVLSIAYNEESFVVANYKNWEGLVDEHLFLVSSTPYNRYRTEHDNTIKLLSRLGCTTISRYWASEEEQRNFGLAFLYNYDYVFIVDPDEFYSRDDIKKMIRIIEGTGHEAYHIKKINTYWKTLDYICDPPDSFHEPVVAVNPKKIKFYSFRKICLADDIDANFLGKILPVTMHHLSFVRNNEKMKEKTLTYGHSSDFKNNEWYNNIWLRWTPGSDMVVRPHTAEKSIAVKTEPPLELRELLTRYKK